MIRDRIKRRSTLGDRLKSAREGSRVGGKRLTQLDLARAVGVDRNTVSRWETGGMVPRDPKVLASLAAALNVTVDWLISGEPEGSVASAIYEDRASSFSPPATAALPAGARGLATSYLERLRASGCSQAQQRGAESLLLACARNTVSSKPIEKRADVEVSADVDAAWDVVVRILRREGIRP